MGNERTAATTAATTSMRNGGRDDRPVRLDPYRHIVFPNAVRELRKRAGYAKLLGLAVTLPDIPYIRLSKIERGEVFAKASELVRIAEALKVPPAALLIDVDGPAFDIAAWAAEFREPRTADGDAEELAVMLAAALRLKRASDPALSIAVIDKQYGIPPVILSRIENAQKTLDRWNGATVASLCRLFGVRAAPALEAAVRAAYRSGKLDSLIGEIANPEARMVKTRARTAELRMQLGVMPARLAPLRAGSAALPPGSAPASDPNGGVRLLPVYGAPLADGLIAPTPTAEAVPAPARAGPRAFGLRVLRPTLGAGMPAHATVIVDPDRFPSLGLAVVREGDGYRLLAIMIDRDGTMIGRSENPAREIAIDELDPADVYAVLGALFD